MSGLARRGASCWRRRELKLKEDESTEYTVPVFPWCGVYGKKVSNAPRLVLYAAWESAVISALVSRVRLVPRKGTPRDCASP